MVNEYGVFHAVYALVGKKQYKSENDKMAATGSAFSHREDPQPITIPRLLLPEPAEEPRQACSSLRVWGRPGDHIEQGLGYTSTRFLSSVELHELH